MQALGLADGRELFIIDVVGGRATAQADEMVLGGVHGDPVEPGVELGVAAELRQGAPSADEGLLHHVLGLGLVTDVAPDQGRDAVLVLADEQVEGRAVTGLDALHELEVVGVVAHPGPAPGCLAPGSAADGTRT